ncbi:MAG: QueT transporter family protein [Ruminococcaceae bacterium]|nr:QueT transporter family protein [Oscillospiraceae bacterium]
MKKNTRYLVQCAMIAALYAVLAHLQNFIFPGSASMAVQFRCAEALCALAFFTPAAIPGLTLGCLLFNLTFGGALPFDFFVGSAASFLTAWCIRKSRSWTIGGFPLPGLLMPALFNGLLVGAELTLTAGIGGAFWLNAVLVAAGELGVMFTLGVALYYTIKLRHLERKLFP